MTTPVRLRRAMTLAGLALITLIAAGCASARTSTSADDPVPAALEERLVALDDAVTQWQQAMDLPDALRAAEAARNLVVGPDNALYGDADGDGTVSGENGEGLLPGETGAPGLAQEYVNACVERDVLGGSWQDPQARWDEFDEVLAAWSPAGNTMPQLASHPQRVVGWATLTLAEGTDLDTAHEFAGHARLHVDVTDAAVYSCAS
ncbi:hypothetical protein GCM10009808_09960 [Microbacterium sediminicola]|uniref:Lipoprotein n=1 Tax=Microbacterium sediminicola TaxID=415210 RepID=A0ABP4TXX7_9MICO